MITSTPNTYTPLDEHMISSLSTYWASVPLSSCSAYHQLTNPYNTSYNTSYNTPYTNTSWKYEDPWEKINSRLDVIEQRLYIINTDLKNHENFSALKKAYDNYKLIEKLCMESAGNKIQ